MTAYKRLDVVQDSLRSILLSPNVSPRELADKVNSKSHRTLLRTIFEDLIRSPRQQSDPSFGLWGVGAFTAAFINVPGACVAFRYE